MGDYFWATASAIATLIAIVDWIRSFRHQGVKPFVYPVVIAVLAAVSTYQVVENHRMRSIENEAGSLLSSWPPVDELTFKTKGERIGIALSGLAFLEKHRSDFPETYETARKLVEIRGQEFRPPVGYDAAMTEYALLEDLAATMEQLVASIAGQRVRRTIYN